MITNQLTDYRDWIDQLKSKIKSARIEVALSVNSQLIELYWDLGKELSEKSKSSNWGSGIIEKISVDLKHEFPDMKGFSRRNLYAIKQWFEFYSEKFEFVPQAAAQIPWGHNRLIINKVKTISEALFYALETVNQGWSRDVLNDQLDSRLIDRKAA